MLEQPGIGDNKEEKGNAFLCDGSDKKSVIVYLR